MGYTTFTGPVRAGNILDTTGLIPGANVSNVGQVVMAQTAIVSEGATPAYSTIQGLTTLCLPAYSQILSIEIRATVPFTSAVSIGSTSDGVTFDPTYFSDLTSSPIATGYTNISTTTLAQSDNWLNVGYPDQQVVVTSATANGPGRGILTITYLQGPNGNT